MNHCKNILKYSKYCNFYDNIVNFITCDKKSKHTSKNVIIVKKINKVFIKNTKKINIKNYLKIRKTK